MTLPIPAGTYGVDPMHSQFEFSVLHLGISNVRGVFDTYTGSLTVGETLSDTVVTITAEMGSVNSGNKMRDDHIQGADFFDTANHPTMEFSSTSIVESGSGYALNGNLTIKGQTLPVTFDTTYNGSATFPMDQSTHFGFTATGAISRSAYGITYGVPMVSDEVKLTLNVQFVSPAAQA